MRKYLILLILFIVIIMVPLAWFLVPRHNEVILPLKPIQKHHFAYKINIDTLNIVYGKVKNNENISAILSPFISGPLIDRIARETSDVFDVRKFHAGNKYARITTKSSPVKTLYFIYEINDVDHVIYDFRDSLRVYPDKKKVDVITKTAEGSITTSLWNAFVNNNLDINLAIKLSDVYAWTVDFYGLQKGDHFRFVYEELYVDSTYIGTEKILSAKFNSSGKDFYAFYFEKDSIRGYFDETGKSLRKAFLKAPLHFSRISSRYSKARMHPILRIVRPHYGVDYSAPRGTPIVALGDGRIAEAGWKGGYGRFVSIRHNSVYTSTYAHLSGYAKGIKPGTYVHQGEVIGQVGMSGLATGPHLDFRVYKNGSPVDPLKIESPSTRPVDKAFRDIYGKMVLDMKRKLDSVERK